MIKLFLLICSVSLLSISSNAQTYTWTNKCSQKININFKYDRVVGSNVLLSKEFNPGETLRFENLSGTVTQAIISTNGFWNGKFKILYMGNCATCNSPGNYDIMMPPPTPVIKPTTPQPQTQPAPVIYPSVEGIIQLDFTENTWHYKENRPEKGIVFSSSVTIINGFGKNIAFRIGFGYKILGDDESTFKSLAKQINYACKSNHEVAHIQIFIPYTELNISYNSEHVALNKYTFSAHAVLLDGETTLIKSDFKTYQVIVDASTKPPPARFGAKN